MYILQAPEIQIRAELTAITGALGVPMLAASPVAPADAGSDNIRTLGDHDAADMLALATLTEPGPFLLHTHHMGRFFGIHVDGRLVAMAGERFRAFPAIPRKTRR